MVGSVSIQSGFYFPKLSRRSECCGIMVNLRLMLMPIDGIGCGVETRGSRYRLLVQGTWITPNTLMAASSDFVIYPKNLASMLGSQDCGELDIE